MYDISECVSKYRRLLDLLEEDSEKMAQGLQGDLLGAYRSLIEHEKVLLDNAIITIKNKFI